MHPPGTARNRKPEPAALLHYPQSEGAPMTTTSFKLDARMMSDEELAAHIQYTNISPNATRDDIIAHLETCARYKFNAAMVQMCWVGLAREVLRGTGVKVATCIGVGMGGESLHGKILLIRECVALGAD